jgi:SAM-dependent methyltransferase
MIRKVLRRQTLASFDYQWRELPEGGGLLSDEWFNDHAADIIARELLAIDPSWFAGKRVLDAGSGSGRWTVGLLRLGCDVTAVDFSEHALGYVRANVETLVPEHADRLETLRVNLLEPPPELIERRFDLVFSFGVLHHTGDTGRALANVGRLVDATGVMFLYLYGRASLPALPRVKLAVQRIALAPLPFRVKQRAVALVRPGSDVHQSFDLLSPTINDRHTYPEVEQWLRADGFPDVVRTAEHTELFVRAARDAGALEPFLLPLPQRPYWFERYA